MKAIPALRFIESYKNLNLFTCEGRIIAFLIENEQASLKEIVIGLKYSNSSIVNKLKILQSAGLIKKSKIDSSKFMTYQVNPQALDLIADFQLNTETYE
jgi:DNA-binding MarR family transcriptional regulator